jgi:CubicO group peptidase (beta-lactamase class C family)
MSMIANKLDRRSFIAGLGAATTLSGCTTMAGPPSGMPLVADVAAAAPESVGMAASLTGTINAMMKAHIDANEITGGVTAVARKNRLVHFAAHGMFDREAAMPMKIDGVFRMMSSTKPITGVALLQQRELAKVSLEDGISKFIPELKTMSVWKSEALATRRAGGQAAMRAPVKPEEVVPANREITIKDLATHTSGLNGTARSLNDTLAVSVPRLKDVPLDFQPGTKWAYSATTGPDVLARVVEICSGQSYDQYIKQHVFDPIGMTSTAHNLNAEQITRRVPRYAKARDGSGWQLAETSAKPDPMTYFAGSYGLNGTAHDYLLFETMLLNKGTIHAKRVLSPESVELMHTNLIGDLYHGLQGTTQGTGFGVLVRTVLDPSTCNCNRSTGAFGWGGAYGTMSWTDPQEKLVAVIMIQQSVDQVQRDFEAAIRKAIVAKA